MSLDALKTDFVNLAHYKRPPKIVKRPRKQPKSLSHIENWYPIENDPVVLTELIRKFGTKGARIEDLWSIEDSIFENIRPVHGLIFLFKYIQDDEPSQPIVTDERTNNIYFAKQVIKNACATQAFISVLLNCNHPDIVLGFELTKLREFSLLFEPKMRGLLLGNTNTIRIAHNSMALRTLSEYDAKQSVKSHDPYSFIAYMPIDGHLYELDGLREGPVDHGTISPEQDWLDVVRPILMKKINVYTEGEIYFHLMALVSDRKAIYERQMQEIITETQMLSVQTADLGSQIQRLRMSIEYENARIERYKREMIRRRHNYLPFLVALLKILSKDKKFMPLYEKAKERALREDTKKMKV